MKCIISPFNSCYHNMASEEYYISAFHDDVFYLYINSPCIVIGKNQNAYAEINQKYVAENHIDVVRRQSGGGAVYHDFGNLNYGFVIKDDGRDIESVFRNYTLPILQVLRSFGADADFSGRNDLIVSGKKISGNAQYRTGERVLQHGTLLVQSDLTAISYALNVSPLKYNHRSTKSVRSRIANINDFLPGKITLTQLADSILNNVLEEIPGALLYELSDSDRSAINDLAAGKYSAWEWVYGNSPQFTYRNLFRFDKGTLELRLNVQSGFIKDIVIYGDFFGDRAIEELTCCLTGIPYDKGAIKRAVYDKDIEQYIRGLEKEMFIESFFE